MGEDGNNNINNNKCYNEDKRRNMMNDLLDGLQRVDNYDEFDNFNNTLGDDDVDNDNNHNNDKPCNNNDSFIHNEEYEYLLKKWKKKAMQIAKIHRTNNGC